MKLNTIYSYFIIILFAPLIGKLINKIIIYYKSYKGFEKDTHVTLVPCLDNDVDLDKLKETVNDLISHDCIKQKSLILKPPTDIPSDLIHHFIRGFLMGTVQYFGTNQNLNVMKYGARHPIAYQLHLQKK